MPSQKYCTHCGTSMPADSLFCPSCGSEQGPVAQAASAAPQPAPTHAPQTETGAPARPASAASPSAEAGSGGKKNTFMLIGLVAVLGLAGVCCLAYVFFQFS